MKVTQHALNALSSIVLVLCCANAWAQMSEATRPVTQAEWAILNPTRDMLDKGRAIAEASCSRCHGLDGISSDNERPNLAGQRGVFLYRVIQAYQNGKRVDASMGHVRGFLNDEGMMSVAAYYANQIPVRSLRPQEVSEAEIALSDDPFADLRPALGKCVKCHAESGNSTASGMPNLTSQDPAYFVDSMRAYADGDRKNKIMKKLAARLDSQTVENMGIYYAVQEPARSATTAEGSEMSGPKLAENCSDCHGEDGNASAAKTPSLAGQDARYFVKAMKEYQDGERESESMFKAVEGLSDLEIQDLAAFYAAREPVRRNVRAPLTTGEWIVRCERCHGIDGNSRDPRFPMLAGQNLGYMAKSLGTYANDVRESSTMHAMSASLNTSDVEKLALYFASKEPKSVIYLELPCDNAASQ